MKQFICISLFLALLACSVDREILIEQVQGDLWIRQIASDNQNNVGKTDVTTSTGGLPIEGIPSLNSRVISSGIFSDHSVIIRSVSGSVYIEEFGNRNQLIEPISGLLDKVYIPGDPFESKNESEGN